MKKGETFVLEWMRKKRNVGGGATHTTGDRTRKRVLFLTGGEALFKGLRTRGGKKKDDAGPRVCFLGKTFVAGHRGITGEGEIARAQE